MSVSETLKPYRLWPETMPFRKNGTPVVGTMGSSVRQVIVMESETFKRLVREHPSLATAQFEVAENAAGADEETPIRLAVKELLDAIALHPRGSTMMRHAIDKIVDLHIDALDEATAALSTAEREREELRDTLRYFVERFSIQGTADSERYDRALALLARVPSGGEEGQS